MSAQFCSQYFIYSLSVQRALFPPCALEARRNGLRRGMKFKSAEERRAGLLLMQSFLNPGQARTKRKQLILRMPAFPDRAVVFTLRLFLFVCVCVSVWVFYYFYLISCCRCLYFSPQKRRDGARHHRKIRCILRTDIIAQCERGKQEEGTRLNLMTSAFEHSIFRALDAPYMQRAECLFHFRGVSHLWSLPFIATLAFFLPLRSLQLALLRPTLRDGLCALPRYRDLSN